MKCVYSMVAGLLTLMPVGFVAVAATAIIPNSVIAADTRIRTQVMGFGTDKYAAEKMAKNAADKVTFSRIWYVVETSIFGSGSNWIYTMIIEYTVKEGCSGRTRRC